jgi:putative Mg2+ transporter-C (MgtC) family protein
MNRLYVDPSDWKTLIFRLMLAMLAGSIIGLNRQRGGRSAGIRTFSLVSMGSAVFVMVPLLVEEGSPFLATNALSRTVQGVATGVGFLGGGLILQQSPKRVEQPRVRGLTTAAAIWITAALGTVIGCGLWELGLAGSVLTLLTLSGLKRIQHWTLLRQWFVRPMVRGQPDKEV